MKDYDHSDRPKVLSLRDLNELCNRLRDATAAGVVLYTDVSHYPEMLVAKFPGYTIYIDPGVKGFFLKLVGEFGLPMIARTAENCEWTELREMYEDFKAHRQLRTTFDKRPAALVELIKRWKKEE